MACVFPKAYTEIEGCSCAGFTLHENITIHQAYQPFADCQPETRSLVVTLIVVLNLPERFKQKFEFTFFNADAGICDYEPYPDCILQELR